jgi:hypothetical protein
MGEASAGGRKRRRENPKRRRGIPMRMRRRGDVGKEARFI